MWIPHQVAKEYHTRRLEVILEQEKKYDLIIDILNNNFKNIENELKPLSRHPFIKTNLIIDKIEKYINKLKKDLAEKKVKEFPNWFNEDEIRDKITELFDSRVGEKFPIEEIKDIIEKGKLRFKNKIPPGYKDLKKSNIESNKEEDQIVCDEDNAFGDLIIWFEIIKKAKEVKKPIIFVSDDRKDDWWWRINGRTIGARYELIREMKDDAGTIFYMYDTDRFIKYAQEYLISKIDNKVSKELKDFKKSSSKELNFSDWFSTLNKIANYQIPKFDLPNYQIPKSFYEQWGQVIKAFNEVNKNIDVSIYALNSIKQDLLHRFDYISQIDIRYDEKSDTINCVFTLLNIPEKITTILKSVYAQIPLNNHNLYLTAKDINSNILGYLTFKDGEIKLY